MKISRMLRKAANRHLSPTGYDIRDDVGGAIEQDVYSCFAICLAAGVSCCDTPEALSYYVDLMAPSEDDQEREDPWWDIGNEGFQAERFMALLFAAEAAESEGL